MLITHRGMKFYICGWEPDSPDRCEMCNQLSDDLRPFGRNGQWICYDCCTIDQEQSLNRYKKLMAESDMVIAGGKFHSKSSENEVRSYLENLFDSKPDHFNDGTFH